ncbi:MAG: hypothetical protein IPM86_09545 [Saprospiraceae bacterium]|nr:hypothetical protein [Saprospiraceae bacterium]
MKKYYFLGVLVFISYFLSAQISGTVFRDFNGDGIRQSGEPLISDIKVKRMLLVLRLHGKCYY